MIYINPTDPEILFAKENHFQNIKCFLRKKLNQQPCGDNCEICTSGITNIHLPQVLLNFLLEDNNLEKIIIALPNELFDLNIQFWTALKNDFNIDNWSYYIDYNVDNIAEIKKNIEKIFNYKNWFCKKDSKYYSAYDLSKNLNRNTCIYCNRIYTSTIVNKKGIKIIRPTLDHWFPKSDFPLLALSFHNLVPSCSNCNSSVKGATNFNLVDYIHPYVDEKQSEEFVFKYRYNSTLDNYRIYLQDNIRLNSKARNTLQKMYIDEMYNSHQCELRDLIKIKKNYSKSYIESIEKLFGNRLTKEEVYRILFGVEFDSKDFHKLPLSKFKSDILKDLDII